MKAVGLTRYLPIDDPDSLQDIELPKPALPVGHDILVKVAAVSVNPVDTKVRSPKDTVEASPRILGYDACGTVEAIGDAVTRFKPGDRVFYAGDITRPGSNAEWQAVDARIVGHAPRSLDDAAAAALPLTSLTAWELLFQRMPFDSDTGGHRDDGTSRTLLVIAGAGGVGSIAIQLARRAGFTVIATASREDSIAWCEAMGAHHVINHRKPLGPQLEAIGIDSVDAALNLADTVAYWDVLGELLAPQGHVGLIVEPSAPLMIGDPYKMKCIGIHWEMMFARSALQTADIEEQGHILDRIATLVDAGLLKSIQRDSTSPINAGNLRDAHRQLESGQSIGKLVLSGW